MFQANQGICKPQLITVQKTIGFFDTFPRSLRQTTAGKNPKKFSELSYDSILVASSKR